MIATIFVITAGLFFLKIVWNILIPFDLAWRFFAAESDEPVGTSLMPYVEIGLWLFSMVFALFDNGSGWVPNWKKIAVWGGGAILLSYMIFAALCLALGWFAANLKNKRNFNLNSQKRQ